MFKKIILISLALLSFNFIIIFSSYSAPILPNIPFTMIDLKENDTYQEGFQRLAYVVKKTKGIDCKVKEMKQVTVVDHPEIKSHYKVTLESNVKWVNGHWICDLVPYTAENMSIITARSINKKYDWWYVYYANGKPEAIVWARYGN